MNAERARSRVLLALGVAALGFAGCKRESPPEGTTIGPSAKEAPTGPAASVPAPPAPAPAPAADGNAVSGTVVETMDSGGYTYAKLDSGTAQVWVAGPETKLAVGTKVGTVSGMPMTAFHSDTLKRTFDQIYFISAFPIAGAAPASPHTGAPAPVAAVVEKVEPAAGGLTVAQIYAQSAALAGKPVAVRGKVVKVNNGILDHNWIHLQDGTGAGATGDLLITTAATVEVGQVVVARGKLATDKDFGAGYKYAVLVEDAAIAAK